MRKDQKFVNLRNAKRASDKKKYSKVIEQIKNDGVCPFCPDQLLKYHKNPVIEENSSWIASKNMYPYKGAKHHIIFIHKKHITSINEIKPKAWTELQRIISLTIKKLKIDGGTMFIRFGDTRYNGASVSHLHAHLISPQSKNPKRSPVLVRIA